MGIYVPEKPGASTFKTEETLGDRGRKFLGNVSIYLPNYRESY
jgi:hypothetical protein